MSRSPQPSPYRARSLLLCPARSKPSFPAPPSFPQHVGRRVHSNRLEKRMSYKIDWFNFTTYTIIVIALIAFWYGVISVVL